MINIDKIKEAIKIKIKSTLANNIRRDTFSDELYQSYSVKEILYKKENSSKRIDAEILTHNNAPTNFTFSDGKMYSYAEFDFAIEGNEHHLPLVFDKTFLHVNNLIYNSINHNKTLVYRIYSPIPIEGNDEVLKRINESANNKRIQIEQKIQQFNQQAESVNIKLKKFIDEIVQSEREIIDLKKSSLDKLNPF